MRGEGSNYDRPARRPGAQDERAWSAISHASVLIWPFTGFLPVVPLIIWLLFRERSPMVSFHAVQSLLYQAAWLVIGVVSGFFLTVLAVLTLGLGLILVAPLVFVLCLIPFVHQLYAAYRVLRGADYRYPLIADRVEGRRVL
jgi:uncharacterized Tic20 family protein